MWRPEIHSGCENKILDKTGWSADIEGAGEIELGNSRCRSILPASGCHEPELPFYASIVKHFPSTVLDPIASMSPTQEQMHCMRS